MTDWIQDKAAQIKKRQEQAEEARQSGLHESDVISTQSHAVLDKLEVVLRKDVEQWNSQFPSDVRQRIDGVDKSIPGGFVVHKTGYPSATLRVAFDAATQSIQFEAIKLRAIGEGAYSVKGLFHLKLADAGDIYLTNRSGEVFSLEDASRHLLEAVLDT